MGNCLLDEGRARIHQLYSSAGLEFRSPEGGERGHWKQEILSPWPPPGTQIEFTLRYKNVCTYSLPGSNQDMKGKCQDTRE